MKQEVLKRNTSGSRFRLSGALGMLLAVAVSAAPSPALAVDAVAGRTAYNTVIGPAGSTCSTSSCHKVNPSTGANKIRNGANNPAAIQRGINNDDGGMRAYNGRLTANDIANIAGYIGITGTAAPLTLSFPSTNVGSTSTAQTVTITSTGVSALRTTSFSTSSAEFDIVSGGTCVAAGTVAGYNTTTAAYSSCTLRVSFSPTAGGARTGTLSVVTTDPAAVNKTVSLSGTGADGALPVASISPSSLSYGAVTVGTQSATQTVTLSNTGAAALNITSIASSSTDFTLAGGTCAVGTPVAASSGSCTVMLRFAPQSAGAKSGMLSIAHNASGSPSTVALSGSGSATSPVAQGSPTTLSFSQAVGSTSAAQTVTLSNTGSAALSVSAVALSGTHASNYLIASGTTCTAGSSVAAGSSCVVKISFTPSAVGARTASLGITHDDTAHSPSTVSLSGTGTTVAAGQVSLNKTAMTFAAQSQNSKSATQTVTVTNSGSATLTLSSFALSGTNAADYAIENADTTCTTGAAMPVNGTCVVGVSFTPSVSTGTRTATLTVSSTTSSNASMSISGTAAAPSAPLVTFTPNSLSFGFFGVGVQSGAQTVALFNSGSSALDISNLSASPSDYQLTHDCPVSLSPAASCTLSIRFTPSAIGSIGGAVTLTSNAATSPDSLALSGSGATVAGALFAWSDGGALSFADTTLFTQSPGMTLTMANQGASTGTIEQIQVGGAHGSEFMVDPSSSCSAGVALVSGETCDVVVVFTPAGGGARSASLSVTSNASGPGAASLTGSGVANGAPVLTLSPTFLNLAGAVNGGLQAQSLVLQNDGAGVLTVSEVRVPAGAEWLDASMPDGGTCPVVPFDVQPGASCTMIISPRSSDPIDGSVDVVSNAGEAPASAMVSGIPLSNKGAVAGGCSIGPTDSPFDPTWALMLLAASIVLIQRRRERRKATRVE